MNTKQKLVQQSDESWGPVNLSKVFYIGSVFGQRFFSGGIFWPPSGLKNHTSKTAPLKPHPKTKKNGGGTAKKAIVLKTLGAVFNSLIDSMPPNHGIQMFGIKIPLNDIYLI